MIQAKGAELIVAVAGFGVYADFFSTTVATPLGLLFALGMLPTGDVLRYITVIMNRYTPAIETKPKK